MTEQMAIKTLEDLQRLLTNYRHISKELTEANGMAIQALEKQSMVNEILNEMWALNEIAKDYSAIGTLEEFKALKEKSVAKKPIDISRVRDSDGYIGLVGKCPCCEDIVEEDTLYCDCGQHLDWE